MSDLNHWSHFEHASIPTPCPPVTSPAEGGFTAEDAPPDEYLERCHRLLYAEWRPNPDEPPVWFVSEIPAIATMDRKASECVIAVTQEVAVPKMQEHDSRVRLEDIRWWTEAADRFPWLTGAVA